MKLLNMFAGMNKIMNNVCGVVWLHVEVPFGSGSEAFGSCAFLGPNNTCVRVRCGSRSSFTPWPLKRQNIQAATNTSKLTWRTRFRCQNLFSPASEQIYLMPSFSYSVSSAGILVCHSTLWQCFSVRQTRYVLKRSLELIYGREHWLKSQAAGGKSIVFQYIRNTLQLQGLCP